MSRRTSVTDEKLASDTAQKEEMATLGQNLDAKKNEIDKSFAELGDTKKEVEKQVSDLRKEVEVLEEKVEASQEELKELSNDRARKVNDFLSASKAHKDELTKLEREKVHKIGELDKLRTEELEVGNLLSVLAKKKIVLEAELRALALDLDSLKEKGFRASESVTLLLDHSNRLEVEIADKQRELQGLEKSVETGKMLESSLAAAKKELTQTKNEVSVAKDEVKQAKNELKKIEDLVREEQSKLGTIKEEADERIRNAKSVEERLDQKAEYVKRLIEKGKADKFLKDKGI